MSIANHPDIVAPAFAGRHAQTKGFPECFFVLEPLVMKLQFSIKTEIEKPVAEVFSALVNPEKIEKYFAHQASGPLVEGAKVVWSWKNYGDYPIEVRQVISEKKIIFTWQPHRDALHASFELRALENNRTLLTIQEEGWKEDQKGLDDSYGNCSGWTHMALCLKAFIEHGIDLRDS